MVRRQHAQRNIFEMILPDGEKLWDPALRRIDEVLEDEALIDQVEEALRRRRPQSGVRGRPGTPAAVALRMLVLKHLYDWSFEECEREVRGSLAYRAFCRIGCEAVPDDTTLIRVAQALGPEVLKAMLERLVEVARQRKLVRGRKLRVDTTVVETNIHHPTDSTLLQDGVRVITRTLHKIRRVLEQTRARVLKGDTHPPGKVLSVFESHTEAIRKGKKVKPTEFGKLVKIQEAESQFITDYEVCAERVPDGDLWEPSLERHQQLFGRAPRLVTADAAF